MFALPFDGWGAAINQEISMDRAATPFSFFLISPTQPFNRMFTIKGRACVAPILFILEPFALNLDEAAAWSVIYKLLVSGGSSISSC